jgi:hypothetical protein
MPVEILVVKVELAVTSTIKIVSDLYGTAVLRYVYPIVYIVNAKELKDLIKGGLESPE